MTAAVFFVIPESFGETQDKLCGESLLVRFNKSQLNHSFIAV